MWLCSDELKSKKSKLGYAVTLACLPRMPVVSAETRAIPTRTSKDVQRHCPRPPFGSERSWRRNLAAILCCQLTIGTFISRKPKNDTRKEQLIASKVVDIQISHYLQPPSRRPPPGLERIKSCRCRILYIRISFVYRCSHTALTFVPCFSQSSSSLQCTFASTPSLVNERYAILVANADRKQ